MNNKKTKCRSKVSFLIILIMCLQFFSNNEIINVAFADENKTNDIKITEILLTDENGKEYDLQKDTLNRDSSIYIEYKFEIPEDKFLSDSNNVKIDLPKQIIGEKVTDFSIKQNKKAQENETTGQSVKVNDAIDIQGSIKNNFIELSFLGLDSEHEKIKGSFAVKAKFNKKEIEEKDQDVLVFTAPNGDEVERYTINFEELNYPVAYLNALSNEIDFEFITGVYISDKKFQGDLALDGKDFEVNYTNYYNKELKTKELEKNSKVYIGYTFEIPEDKSVKKGDTFEMKLPDEFGTLGRQEQPLVDSYGTQIATATFELDNTVQITFLVDVEKSDVQGNFWCQRNFDGDKIGTNSSYSLKFNIPILGEKIFDLKFKQSKAPIEEATIVKDGGYSASEQIINWSITVDAKSEERKNVKVTDNLDTSKHKYKAGTLKVDGQAVDDSNFNGNNLEYVIGDMPENTKKVIEFQTIPEDLITQHENVDIPNTATLYVDGCDPKQSQKTVTVRNSFILKVGSYDMAKQQINWEIKFNETNTKFTNPEIIDVIPKVAGKLDTTNVMMDGNKLAASQFNYDENTNEFSYKFSGDVKNMHIFKFSTKIDSDVIQNTFYNTQQIVNTVQLKSSNKPDISYTTPEIRIGGFTNEMVTKEAISYEKHGSIITWKLNVNSAGIKINNAIIEDEIRANQAYVDNSVTIDGSPASGDKVEVSSNKIRIKLGNINKSCVVTLKTKITNQQIIYKNVSDELNKCSNYCCLIGDNIRNGGYSTETSKGIDSRLLSKLGKYDYKTRHITWTLKVNEAQIPINDARIIDTIEEGQKYVEGSFKIERTAGNIDNAEGLPNKKDSYTPTSSDDLERGGELEYFFGDGEINDCYTITYETEVSDEKFASKNSDITISNTAKLKTPDTSINISDSAKVMIKNYLVEKNVEYTKGSEFLTWKVNINKNSIVLKNGTIIDIIPEGLQLDLDSVKLYEKEVDSEGNEISRTEVGSGYKLSYDAKTREFKIELPENANKFYLLVFDTIANEEKSYSNTIKLTDGENRTYNSTEDSDKVEFSEHGGSITGDRGIIALGKRGKENAKPLKGAVFQLIRVESDGTETIVQTSEPTADNGETLFRRVKYGDYILREIEAPKGYKKCVDMQITINDATLTNKIQHRLEKTVEDEQIRKTLELYNVSSDGVDNKPLKGAKFNLYNENDLNTILDSVTSNEKGIVQFKDLLHGNYIIKEVGVPEGYILPFNREIRATINGTEEGDIVKANPYTIVNEMSKFNLKFMNRSNEGKVLGGATFCLYGFNDNKFTSPIRTYVTTSDGVVFFDNILYGNYKVKQTSAPQGYDLNDEPFNVTTDDFKAVNIDSIPVLIVKPDVINKLKKTQNSKIIELLKVKSDGKPLEGAIFALYNKDDKNFDNILATASSNNEGFVRFTNVEKGEYKIKEIKAPQGYKLNDTVIYVGSDKFNTTDIKIKTEPYEIVNVANGSGSGNGGSSNSSSSTGRKHNNNNKYDSNEEKLEDKKENTETTISDEKEHIIINNSVKDNQIKFVPASEETGKINLHNNSKETNPVGEENYNFENGSEKQYVLSANNMSYNEKDRLPQAGQTIDTKVLILAGLLLIITGVIYNKNLKKKYS